MQFSVFVIPALLALLAKAVIFFYARSSTQHNLETKLYLLFLFAMSLQNIAEINMFLGENKHTSIFIYFSASILAIATILHLGLTVGLHPERRAGRTGTWLVAIYLPCLILEVLLWTSDLIIQGYEPMGYTYTKRPGPLYYLFAGYLIVYFAALLAVLIHGSMKLEDAVRRARARLVLFGVLPLITVALTVIGLQHYHFRAFNTTVTLPIAATFFLVVTAYATHQYRIFDIGFYLPWSKIRARKTAFYSRIRAIAGELKGLSSVNEAINLISNTLQCPVALVEAGGNIITSTVGHGSMVAMPSNNLRSVNQIKVAKELAEAEPETYRVMQTNGIAAIIPFNPYKQKPTGWLLFGDRFSNEIYSTLDFQVVEELFAKLADLFLDKINLMRSQTDTVLEKLDRKKTQLYEMQARMESLKKENNRLRQENILLLQVQGKEPIGVVATEHDIPMPLEKQVSNIEKSMIERALRQCKWNKSKTARLLGIRPNTLHYKIERYKIIVPKKNGGDNS